ncbi:hypothetical protein DW920_13145 [Clostridium sp. AM42-36]|jgi:protein-S-isoprenylcysteine O-methyltransferase Ste14|nr:hypothetical protein DW920_13145 [Clostridium sp. AM42-36]
MGLMEEDKGEDQRLQDYDNNNISIKQAAIIAAVLLVCIVVLFVLKVKQIVPSFVTAIISVLMFVAALLFLLHEKKK